MATGARDLTDLRARLADLMLRDEHRLRRRLDALRRAQDPDALAHVAADIERARERVERRRAAVPAITYPAELPVSARRDDLAAAIRGHQVVVVAGETGSGKTTQIPKVCLELGRGIRGQIGHTQPRRIAARTVAERIADELGVPLGEAVGYAVRFNDRSGEDTLVRLMTDGLLLAELQHDRLLRRYDTIIVDEAHERSLNIDFLLGYLHRLLPRRPDLKVVITSATIDPQRFAAHFGDAPVVEVSGRTYPVEVRYRPLTDPEDPTGEERDPIDAIGDAVDELMTEKPGDVLVFLSGEREIRDTAEALSGRYGPRLEVLPLYARLSTAEQQRVFRPHDGRRVVLATNVAETSLTVPGIRYVVDPGTARISRWSPRLKVQRLPIEPISQASADQRKGRCGRLSEGVCVRLYSEEDFDERPRFTDPEILRTSLASVLLQMASIGLGDIEEFPFLDPPDRRQIRDGITLLEELGALEGDRRLTPLGRRLAQVPVDPRLARMVLEADRLGCVDEVIVIAAALSIQDPRERPADKQAQADQLHARFSDDDSDFVAFWNLWRHLRERQKALSGNQFRREVKAEFLHYLRVREWQDLVGQLRGAARELKLTRNEQPADAQHVHQALLAGLLSHVGLKDARGREYQGARGARFAVFPGSALAKKPPSWVMVAELVETSRLWGRTAARIQPQWIEPLAEHVVQREHSEPRWSRARAQVVATERVTLYGLPIVTGRTVGYGRIDPTAARAIFIRSALVERDWDTRHEFFHANGRLLAEVEALEDRTRRRDLLVDDDTLVAFFDARVPPSVVSGPHFDRWWRDARRVDPDLLTFTRDLLVRDEAGAITEAGRPARWKQGDIELELSYKFAPGEEDDGVTAHVPLRALPQLRDRGFEWLVPALREELVTTLIRGLPKDLRRALVPIPALVPDVLARLRPRKAPLADALSSAVEEVRGVRVPRDAWAFDKLPPHLRVTFRVEDDEGRLVAKGKELERLRAAARPKLRAELARSTAALERNGMTGWEVGTLPRAVALPGAGDAVRGFPALVDEGDAVGVRVLETPAAQAAAMRLATRRLLLLTIPPPIREVQQRVGAEAQLALVTAPHGSVGKALADATLAALDALVEEAGGPAWDEAGWTRLRGHVAGRLTAKTTEVVELMARVLRAAREVERRLDAVSDPRYTEARHDVAAQLGGLVYPGFAAATGVTRLPDAERYLQAAARRLERLPQAPGLDADRMRVVQELEALRRARLESLPADRPRPAGLVEARWLIEELRVSFFAQHVGVRGAVSAKRVRKLIAESV